MCIAVTFSLLKFDDHNHNFQVFPEELFLDQSRITTQRKMAEGAFGTIWKGSFRRSNGLNYEIAIKTIKVDEDTSREKDKELIDLLKVINQKSGPSKIQNLTWQSTVQNRRQFLIDFSVENTVECLFLRALCGVVLLNHSVGTSESQLKTL